ncbi:MAG: hypothetical protein ABIL06_15435 [Pseudomonadota bacterium]
MGLRSHIMEVLRSADVARETEGVIREGIRWFPRARPLKMLRIFRTRFDSLRNAEEELRRVKIVETYLAPAHVARSNEFLVDYLLQGKYEPLLCGLQEYVIGEVLDPWGCLDKDHLTSLFWRIDSGGIKDALPTIETWGQKIRKHADKILGRIKAMIVEANYVPDLAGIGNLLLTRTGNIKLVDINNISKVSFDPSIPRDDRGYPVCDKSIEALSLLEEKLLGKSINRRAPIYRTFLDPGRVNEVRSIEKEFHLSLGSSKAPLYSSSQQDGSPPACGSCLDPLSG